MKHRGFPILLLALAAASGAFALFAGPATAMDGPAFAEFLTNLEEESFGDDKLNLVKTCASTNTFTCAQVARILGAFDFSDGKLKALTALKNRIEDPRNKHAVLAAFDFDGDKKKASRLLSDIAKPAAPRKGMGSPMKPLVVNHAGCWTEEALASLVKQLKDESFSDGKKRVLRLAVEGTARGFTSEQIRRVLEAFGFDSDMVEAVRILEDRMLGMTSREILPVLEAFSFSADKLKVLAALKDAITDAENKFVILKAFTFSGDKEKARKILESVKARSCIYGTVRSDRVVFVVDVSGSMNAAFVTNRGRTLTRLAFVLRELRHVLAQQLRPETRFNIITFSENVRLWKPAMVSSKKENVKAALSHLSGLRAGGGTNIYGALAQAAAIKDVETVYFLTDGKPTSGAKTNPDQILSDVVRWFQGKKIAVHSVAFLMGTHQGDDKTASRSLMLRLAEKTGGVYRALE
jgi:Mg-chelatase subunit ChlD